MSRKTFFLTKGGLDNFKKRLDALLVERRAIRDRLCTMGADEKVNSSVAADEIKLLERAEAESTTIADILQNAEVITKSDNPTSIQVGSKVRLLSGKNSVEYVVVSPLEVDPLAGKISEDSILGQAILGKKLHDKVQITTPKGEVRRYEVAAIS